MTTAPQSKTVTVGEVKATIDQAIRDFIQYGDDFSINERDLRNIIDGISNDLDLRDYLMGLPEEYGVSDCLDFIHFLIYWMELEEDQGAINILHTIVSAFYYEQGHTETARQFVASGLAVDYSLASLLARVYVAGWPVESFARMRGELHHKVITALEEKASQSIF